MAPRGRPTRLNPDATPTPVTPAPNAPTTTTVTEAQLQALIDQGVAAAMAEAEASRVRNGYNSNGSGPRPAQTARECSYSEFLKCKPLDFKGTEGVVGLTRWFEKMESVFSISNCPATSQVKFATCTLQDDALTWWNSHVKTTTPEDQNVVIELCALRNFDLGKMDLENSHEQCVAKLPDASNRSVEMIGHQNQAVFQIQDMHYGMANRKWEFLLKDLQEEKICKKNDVKARSLLLMALPNEHQLTFNYLADFLSLNHKGINLFIEDLEPNSMMMTLEKWIKDGLTVIKWDILRRECSSTTREMKFKQTWLSWHSIDSEGLEEFKQPEVNEYGPRDSSLKPTTVCNRESNNSKENTDDSLTQQPKTVTETSSVVSSLKVDKAWKEKFFHPANHVRVEEPKKVRENTDAPIIEDWVSDDEKEVESILKKRSRKEVKDKAILIEKSTKKTVRRSFEQEQLSYAEAIRLEEQMNEEQRAQIARDEEIARQWDEEERKRAMDAAKSTKRRGSHRGDGSSKNYKVLSEMLEDFDRLDVEELYRLVKNRYSASSPEGFDLMLWGDLHTLFEPDKDDEIWRDQHEYNLLSWRLCDLCGIHILLMDNGLAIHMLTEKKYPLSQEMLTKMLSRKLEVDHESSQAFELLRFIRS
ncbi:hypothetical protein Tco_1351670 [Tanacetum coccineum]